MFFQGTVVDRLRPDHLVLRVQPDEAISLFFLAKRPGPEINVQTVDMDFNYRESFPEQPPADAYERLLYDALQGDQTLFARGDSVQRAWEVVQPVLDNPSPLRYYPAGSWGPDDATELGNIHQWRLR
jgi:glucose-6-phosphate 1-dehydrogenase